MAQLSVVLIADNKEQALLLERLVEATGVAHVTASFPKYFIAASDPVLRRVQESTPDIVIVDIPADASLALSSILVLRSELPKAGIFAFGPLNQPEIIINAMRDGAREFLGNNTGAAELLEAFVRFTSGKRAARGNGTRGKLFTVLNAKGGSGATTVAVNMALQLEHEHGNAVLVDLAPLGHAALHLNAKASYTYLDALENLHRLDASLLEGYMAHCEGGLHLLAGTERPQPGETLDSDLSRLLDLLVTHYRFVVIDASTRLDRHIHSICEVSDKVLLVAQTDLASLWSASKIHGYLGEDLCHDRVRLVLNRYQKVPGFADADIEATTRTRILWKIPNQFTAVASGISRGIPVAQQNHSAIARSFVGLCGELVPRKQPGKSSSWLSFGA
jgi:pilus assembly protein CpaE